MYLQHQIYTSQQLKKLPRHSQKPPRRSSSLGGGDFETQLEAFLKSFESKFDNVAAGMLNRGKTFQTAITTVVGSSLQQLAKAYSFYEQRNKDLNTGFGITSEKAAGVGEALDKMVEQLHVGGLAAREYAGSLNKIATGFINTSNMSKQLGANLIKAQAYMQDNLKITEEAATGYELYAAGMNRSGLDQLLIQNEIATAIEDATGMIGVQRDLTEEIGKMAADLQIQYGRIPGQLELAVLKSRMLGLSMADLHKTGQGLLDIESSVGKEIEYQALTGRRLIGDKETAGELAGKSLTNEYRKSVIAGDAVKQAEIMNQILEQEGETLETNMFARKSIAELLSTDEATVMRMHQQKKLLQKLDAEALMKLQGDDFEAGLKELAKTIGDDPARQELYNKLIETTDVRTSDERIADAVEKLQTEGVILNVEELEKYNVKNTAELVALTKQGLDREMIDSIGDKMQEVYSIDEVKEVLSKGGSLVTALNLLSTTLGGLKDILAGGELKLDTGAPSLTKKEDALITFNPQDKFMAIAGTDVAGNASLAQAVQNYAGNGNASISSNDMAKLAQTIAAAISNVSLNATIDMPIGSESSMNNGRFS